MVIPIFILYWSLALTFFNNGVMSKFVKLLVTKILVNYQLKQIEKKEAILRKQEQQILEQLDRALFDFTCKLKTGDWENPCIYSYPER